MRPAGGIAHLLVAFFTLTSVTVSSAQSTGRIPESFTGYGGYQFGMTLEQARGVDEQAKTIECDYVDAASFCLEKRTSFFGEAGSITVLFSPTTKRIIQVNISFLRLAGPEGACQRAVKAVTNALFARYGNPTTMDNKRGAQWYAPSGGALSLVNICLNANEGIVVVSYRPSASF